jgi:hypothetical protein
MKDNSCELTFGEIKYELPLNEQTAKLIGKAFTGIMTPPKFANIAEIDAFYNKVMDAIDTILGEGAAENIMSRYTHAGTLELLSVVNFIVNTWDVQYKAEVKAMKKTARITNREQRRANVKGGRR